MFGENEMLMVSLGRRELQILALVLAGLGLVFLYFALEGEYEKMEIAKVKDAKEGMRVLVAGFVESIAISDYGAKVRICDARGECISASVGKEVYNAAFLSRGGPIMVWGTVGEYMGGKSIRAERVERG